MITSRPRARARARSPARARRARSSGPTCPLRSRSVSRSSRPRSRARRRWPRSRRRAAPRRRSRSRSRSSRPRSRATAARWCRGSSRIRATRRTRPRASCSPVSPTPARSASTSRSRRTCCRPHAEWKSGRKVSDTEVRYTFSTDHLALEKVFTVSPDAFLVKMVVTAKVIVPAGKIATEDARGQRVRVPGPRDGRQGRLAEPGAAARVVLVDARRRWHPPDVRSRT